MIGEKKEGGPIDFIFVKDKFNHLKILPITYINEHVNRTYESVLIAKKKKVLTMGMHLIVSKLDARTMNRRLPHKNISDFIDFLRSKLRVWEGVEMYQQSTN